MLIQPLFYRLWSLAIIQSCNQSQRQLYWKNSVFVSLELFYLRLVSFKCFLKFHFVKNRPTFFTIQSQMRHKRVGNQIHRRGLSIHEMKVASTTVEMFWIAKMMLFWPKLRGKCCEKRKIILRLKNQHTKKEFPIGNWGFMAWMEQIRATMRK